ncbi:uncharacterized protein LOC143355872 [Halictus rubicundus]|uniref:uncharacterized protein LOC143355872 n=1 Tax=Halictus rubicundus TaxID=77578 RepID=UPI0040352109
MFLQHQCDAQTTTTGRRWRVCFPGSRTSSTVRVQEARNSIDVQIEDTPKGYPRNFAHNIQSCSSPEIASKVEKYVDAKINSTAESVSHFGWYPAPLSRSLLLVADGPDTQIRGVAYCSPRNTKPPIREPNMPEKQQRKDDKEKKKKKKKPVLRTDASEDFPDVVAMEAGHSLRDNPDVNFRYQWGIKIPEETAQRTQEVHRTYIWGQASNPVTDNTKGLTVRMTASDPEKTSTKTESSSQSAQPMEPSSMDERVETIDKMETEKVLKKASGSSKDNSTPDEDYNIPLGAEFDAEISAWKDLVLKSKMPIDTSNKDDFAPNSKTSADLLSIRPEPPEPKLDVQAIPSTDEEVMKDEDEESIPKELKVNLKKMEGKRTGDVQKIDSKKLHTSQSPYLKSSMADREDIYSSRTDSRRSWTWSTITGLPRLHVVTFSTSSERYWASAEKINDTKGSEAALAGKPTSPDNVDLANVGNMEEVASPDQQLLRNSQQYQTNQPEVDSEFEDSLNAIAGSGISLHSTQEEQEVDDSKMNASEKDSMAMEAEDHHHQSSNSFNQFEDDYVSAYESMSLQPTQERSAKEEHKQDQSSEWTDSDAYDNESQVKIDNYVIDGEYIKVPGDPYPYSKQYFEKWRMSKEDINIGSFVDKTEKVVDPEVPVGDARAKQIDNLPPARSMSHDIHMRNQLSRGKGVPN